MRPDLEFKLLELTRDRGTLTLEELARELHTEPANLIERLEGLSGDGFLSLAQSELELATRQRVLLADHLIRGGRDPHKVTRLLKWQEFEDFAIHALKETGFQTRRHLIFKTRAGRREIDVLAWSEMFLFAIDCKHWARGLYASRVRLAVQAQVERTEALAERPELLSRLGVTRPERRFITPVLLALGEPRDRVVDGVPVVSVSKLMSFLYGLSPIDANFRSVRVKLHLRKLFEGEPEA